MERFTDKTYKSIMLLKNELVETCELCGGNGYNFDNNPPDCKCMMVLKYLRRLIAGYIPKEYWNLSIKNLKVSTEHKELLKNYLSNFDNAVDKSMGLLYFGPNGTGKTAMLCEVGKWAIVYGKRVKYLTLERYVEAVMGMGKDEAFLDELKSAEVLLLDEVGKAYIKDGSAFVHSKIEDAIRRWVTSKVVLCATNMTEDELTKSLGDSVMSALKRHLYFTLVDGADFSDIKQDNWFDSLASKTDYYSDEIVKMAQRRLDNEIERSAGK